MKHKNYYEILNVPQDATPVQIKRAYYSLAKKYHPDVNPKMAHLFCNINEAYETLIDPVKRSSYDAILNNPEDTFKEESTFKQSESDYYYSNAKYYQNIDNEPLFYILKDFNKYKMENIWSAIGKRNLIVLYFSTIASFIIWFATLSNRCANLFKKSLISKKRGKSKTINFLKDCIEENELMLYFYWFLTISTISIIKTVKIIWKVIFFIYDRILRPLFLPLAIILAALFWSNKEVRRYK